MRRSLRLTVLALSLFSYPVLPQQAPTTGSIEAQQLRRLRVEFAAEELRYPLYAPVYAVVSVQNDLDEAIGVDFGRNSKSSFTFSLTLPDGRKIDVPYPSADGLSLSGPRSLEPGETYKQRVLLNEWHHFYAPGVYTVQLKIDALEASFETATGDSVVPLPIERIVVWIGPRDDGQLGRVCRELLALALSDGPVQERVDAADALSRVMDPIAIPYLKQIIEQGVSVQQYGIQGLSRIRNTEAIEILIANLSNREFQRMVTRELYTIERTTIDLQLKARIRAALNLNAIK
jgi:hypothetical protein